MEAATQPGRAQRRTRGGLRQTSGLSDPDGDAFCDARPNTSMRTKLDAEMAATTTSKSGSWWQALSLAYASMGIIYGDIGTSPLYVYASTFVSRQPTTNDIVSVASLIFWTMTITVLLKYVLIVLFADDNGEGGTFALYAIICRAAGLSVGSDAPLVSDLQLSRYSQPRRGADPRPGRSLLERCRRAFDGRSGRSARRVRALLHNSATARKTLLFIVLLLTSMVLGDGVLTPAISVLSAVSGLKNASSAVTTDVSIAITCVILVLLFVCQKFGTNTVGKAFAPIVVLWLGSNAAIGIYNITAYEGPSIFRALSPHHAIKFFIDAPGDRGWRELSGVFLSITGCEALYADLGHFSPAAIRLSFSTVAYPFLIITYLGQASWLISHPQEVSNTYYSSVPDAIFYPMLILATLSSVVASQALISGSFSIVRQSMALGCFPRVAVKHTSASHIGQIYIPSLNYVLMLLSIIVVVTFRSTTAIGYAYGLAINTVMLGTTVLLFIIMLLVWKMPLLLAIAAALPFAIIEALYLSSNLLKVPKGGWFSLVIGVVFCSTSLLWYWGNAMKRNADARNKVQVSDILQMRPSVNGSGFELYHDAAYGPVPRIPGAALIYSPTCYGVPQIFSKLANKWGLHETIVFITIRQIAVPNVMHDERLLFMPLEYPGFYRCIARYGYMDIINQGPLFVDLVLQKMKLVIAENDLHTTSARDLAKKSASLHHVLFSVDFAETSTASADTELQGVVVLPNIQRKESMDRQTIAAGLTYQHGDQGIEASEIIEKMSDLKACDEEALQGQLEKLSSAGEEKAAALAVGSPDGIGVGDTRKESRSITYERTDGNEEDDEIMGIGFRSVAAESWVYVLSRSILKATDGSNILRKLALEVGFQNMYKYVHRSWEYWKIPLDNMFEVGMFHEV